MARSLPPLNALRAFEAAARHLSFKRAAAELHVTPTAISHQIRQLEAHLEIPLFERGTRRIAMTRAAQHLLPVLRDGFDAFAAALESIARTRARTAVTITATTAFATKWLVPRMPRFRSARPDIDLVLLATDDLVDLASGAADLAVRYGGDEDPALDAHTLFVERFAPVANPRLRIRTPADLVGATLIHADWRVLRAENPTWPRWLAERPVRGVDPHAGLRFSDENHAMQATLAGHGIALLSLVLAADELASGLLSHPFGPVLPGRAYRLLRRRGAAAPHVAAAHAWILDETRRRPRRPRRAITRS